MSARLLAARLAAALGLLLAVPAAAGTEPPAPGLALGLRDAVRLTLEHSPEIARGRARSAFQAARYQEAEGLFDPSLSFLPSLDRRRGELLSTGTLREQKRRDVFRLTAEALEGAADQIDQTLLDLDRRPSLECEGLVITFDGRDICLPMELRAASDSFDDTLDGLAQYYPDLAAIRDQLNTLTRSFFAEARTSFRSTASGLRRDLLKLGAIPDIEQETRLTLDLRLQAPLHHGALVSAGLILEGLEDNYDGKPRNPTLGGKGVPTTFTSIAAVGLDLPLGRGRGPASAAATARAAAATWRASREQLRQTVAEQVLRTVLAYWDLAAAQRTAALLGRSRETHERLLEISRALVAADELPRSELSRIEARLAGARGAEAEARQAVLAARLALAAAIGIETSDLGDAPLASDGLPLPSPVAGPGEPALAQAMAAGLALRSDLRAAAELRQGAELLAKAARVDLAPRLDLSLLAGYSGLYETYRRGFYAPRGFAHSFSDRWAGPSFSLVLRLDLPQRNDAARGRLIAAEASLARSAAAERDLRRLLQADAVELARTLPDAAAAADARAQAAARHQETLAAALELYGAGESSLFAVLQTEEQLTRAQLDLVQAAQAWVVRLARSRFTLGELIRPDAQGELTADGFQPFPANAETEELR